eukprot:1127670-Heterocapsa_arctica.AAC.1
MVDDQRKAMDAYIGANEKFEAKSEASRTEVVIVSHRLDTRVVSAYRHAGWHGRSRRHRREDH